MGRLSRRAKQPTGPLTADEVEYFRRALAWYAVYGLRVIEGLAPGTGAAGSILTDYLRAVAQGEEPSGLIRNDRRAMEYMVLVNLALDEAAELDRAGGTIAMDPGVTGSA